MPAVAAVAAATACARVTVQDAGNASIRTHYGILAVDAGAHDGPSLLEIEAFGLSRIGGDFTLGYRTAQIARIPKGDCRIVVWIETPEEAQAIRDLLGARDDVCFTGASKGGGDDG